KVSRKCLRDICTQYSRAAGELPQRNNSDTRDTRFHCACRNLGCEALDSIRKRTLRLSPGAKSEEQYKRHREQITLTVHAHPISAMSVRRYYTRFQHQGY